MATYEEIYGKRVKEFDSDPTLDSSYEGQVWYDKSSGTLRTVTASIAAWASTGPLISARSSGAGFGVSTAAVYAGGGPGANANTFEYNGSGWTTGGSLNTGRGELGGTTAGTETAGLCYGSHTAPPGFNVSATCEEYNGTSWTNGNNMATSVSFEGGSGIQTAAFSAGGRTPSNTNNSQEYDGTNWSNGNNINTTRQALVGMGTQTAGIIAGGESPSGGTNSAETYDGTNFTAAPNMGTARYRLSGSGSDSTACLVFGGRFNPPAADKAQTESFDGTSWTETADLATARQQLSGNRGTSSSAIAAGGLPPPASATADTEEFTQSINTITAAAWASGGATNTALGSTAGSGTQTAGIVFSGADNLNNTELYNGSSWTVGPTLNQGRYGAGEANSAPQTAALCFGGVSEPPVTNHALTEEYNGSAWSESGDLPTVLRQLSGFGIQTAAVSVSGWNGSSYVAESYEYNGSSWTAAGDINTSRERAASFGLETAGVTVGGNIPPSHAHTDTVEEYNGSSWTTATAYPTGIKFASACGTQTDGLVFSGNTPPNSVTGLTLGYDGTSWSTRPSMGTARQAGAGAGTSTAALMMAGSNVSGTSLTTTEEFTGVTETVTAQTLTTS
jgi:hypothetical protein